MIVRSPELHVSSREELPAALDQRDEAFDDVDIDVIPLDVGGAQACAEWTVSMTHAGPIELADGTIVEPTGSHIELHGVSVAEFVDDRIASLRQYWDPRHLLDQLGVTGPAPGPGA